jgi:hypothetical protein
VSLISDSNTNNYSSSTEISNGVQPIVTSQNQRGKKIEQISDADNHLRDQIVSLIKFILGSSDSILKVEHGFTKMIHNLLQGISGNNIIDSYIILILQRMISVN